MSLLKPFAGLAAVGGVALAYRDYRGWRALGEGGLPPGPAGWARMSYLRLLKRDPLDLAVFETEADDRAWLPPLPERARPRPRIAPWPVPHRQLDQYGGTAVRRKQDAIFDAAVRDHAGQVHYRMSHFEKHNPAVTLRCPGCGHVHAARTRGEVAHVHPTDGSMHMVLGARDAAQVVRQGWGERHPLAGLGDRAPPITYLLVYAPRDAFELDVTEQLLAASIRHMAEAPSD